MRGRQREMVADWRKEVGGLRRTKRILNQTDTQWMEKRGERAKGLFYTIRSKGYFQLNVTIYKLV